MLPVLQGGSWKLLGHFFVLSKEFILISVVPRDRKLKRHRNKKNIIKEKLKVIHLYTLRRFSILRRSEK